MEKNSIDGPILAELGGQKRAITTLTELYAAIAAQPNGEDGNLLSNGYANIFYIPDTNDTLRAVDVRWYVDGWDVRAYSVEDLVEWGIGSRVFSRNSLIS